MGGAESNSPRSVHVWRAWLDTADPDATVHVLDRNERRRAERFANPRDASRFVAGRSIVKRVLSEYVDRPAAEIRFDTRCRHCGGDHGKPNVLDHPQLDFSWSSRNGRFVLAVAWRRQVGVDVESVAGWSSGWRDVAREAFGERERARLSALPARAQPAVALRLWTAKEALLKAVGLGLAGDLRSVELTVDPSGAAEGDLRLVGGMPRSSGEQWWLRSVPAGAEHVAMLAVDGDEPTVELHDVEPERTAHTTER